MTGKQAFKRILKDIGIYTVYLNDRKTVGERRGFPNNTAGMPLSHIINCSFCWDETSHKTMWCRLCQASPSRFSCEELIKDYYYDSYINCLNRIVKECISGDDI